MKLFEIIPLPVLVVAIVALINVLTEVTKKIFNVKKPEVVVVAWALLLSVGLAICAAALQGWLMWWQLLIAMVAGCLFGGVLAYAAMFGYDELYDQIIGVINSLVSYINKKGVMFNDSEDSSGEQK